MSSNRLVSMHALLFAAALTVGVPAISSGASAQGQSSGAPLSLKAGTQAAPAFQARPANVASSEEETTPLKDDASHQGVKVHGHWKIVVKNPDGSIAETREFENSLSAGGGTLLGNLLVGGNVYGGATSGGIAIDLTSSGTSICGKTNCGMTPNNTTGVGSTVCGNANWYCSGSNATATVNATGFVLAGQITATQAGTITNVASFVGTCGYSTSNFTCAGTSNNIGYYGNFTATTIPAVAVNSGQIVQVSVTISFS